MFAIKKIDRVVFMVAFTFSVTFSLIGYYFFEYFFFGLLFSVFLFYKSIFDISKITTRGFSVKRSLFINNPPLFIEKRFHRFLIVINGRVDDTINIHFGRVKVPGKFKVKVISDISEEHLKNVMKFRSMFQDTQKNPGIFFLNKRYEMSNIIYTLDQINSCVDEL